MKPWFVTASLTGLLLSWRIATVRPHVVGRLLDIGCGSNVLVRGYSGEGGEGQGVDVHDWGDVDVVVEDTSDLPFPDGSFETVTIVAALNHIPNRDDVLVEARRVLADGGILVVTMIPPNISRIWHRLRQRWDPDQQVRDHHDHEVWGFNQTDLKDMLARAGFAVETETKFMLGINTMTIARKAKGQIT
jgi:SAM-dependent methyltransferase